MGYFVGAKASSEFETLIHSLREELLSGAGEDDSRPQAGKDAHITIAHLGKQLPDTERFQDVAASHAPFEVDIQGASVFRNKQTTHLVLPVCQGADELRVLHTCLRSEASYGMSYNPHITVLSFSSEIEDNLIYRQVIKFRKKFAQQKWGAFPILKFCLFSSRSGVVSSRDSWRLNAAKDVM